MIDRKNESTFLENTQKRLDDRGRSFLYYYYYLLRHEVERYFKVRHFYVLHLLIKPTLCVDARLPAIKERSIV